MKLAQAGSGLQIPNGPMGGTVPLDAIAALETQNRLMEQQMRQQMRVMSLQLAASVAKQGDSAESVIANAEAFNQYISGDVKDPK
jgi:hypothetical protein